MPPRIQPAPNTTRAVQRALALCGLLAACFEPAAPTAGERPNLLLVVIDGLRADHAAAHLTPALDRLASQGTRFTRAYASAPWGAASVASLHTGRTPSAHGLWNLERRLDTGVETLAERLARAGYDCRAIVSDFLLGAARGLDRGFATCSQSEALGPEHVSTAGVTRLGGAPAGGAVRVLLEVDFEPRALDVAAHQRAVVGPRFKLIRDLTSGAERLYDLELDPGEREDVAALHPAARERLSAALDRLVRRTPVE